MKRFPILIVIFILFSDAVYGQRGIFFELKENEKVLSKNYKIIYNASSKLPLVSNENLQMNQIKLNPEYLSWVFLNSNQKYLKLYKPDDICRFTDLAKNKLIDATDRVIFDVKFSQEINDQRKVYGFFKLEQLIAYLERNNLCSNIKLNSESFNDENLQITTSSYELKKPNSNSDCKQLITKVTEDPMAPSFCGIAKEISDANMAITRIDIEGMNLNNVEKNKLNSIIRRGVYIRNKIGDIDASLMIQICHNLDKPENFCAPHLREDIWTRAQNGEFPIGKVQKVCSTITKSNSTNVEDIQKCATIANEMPSSCIEAVRSQRNALFPVSDCSKLSKNLMLSTLETNFLDCPSKVNNHLTINAQRVASNLKNLHKKYKNLSCKELPSKVYSNISYSFDSKSWPLKICYFDPADADDLKICYEQNFNKICTTYKPDAPLNSPQSLKNTLEKVLKEKMNDGIDVNCNFFEKSQLDEYLYGGEANCLVYHEKAKCNYINCPKTILLNKKEVKNVTFTEKELRCLPYIPGNDAENEISENRSISKIVKRIYAAPNNISCEIIPEERYNPIFLKYQQGCFVLSPKKCLASNCRKRIIYNQQEFFNFVYKGNIHENYFEVSSTDKVHSMSKKIKKVLKFEDEKILSLTKIKLWFKNKNKIIHGIGCLEDLYPDFFARQSFNQCEAIPFIVSGVEQSNNTDYIIINTTLDLISYPRKIRWNNLYNSLKMYQHIHPQKLWALYGIH